MCLSSSPTSLPPSKCLPCLLGHSANELTQLKLLKTEARDVKWEEEDTTGNEGCDLSQRYGNLAQEPLTMSANKQTLSLLVFQLQFRENTAQPYFCSISSVLASTRGTNTHKHQNTHAYSSSVSCESSGFCEEAPAGLKHAQQMAPRLTRHDTAFCTLIQGDGCEWRRESSASEL